MGEFRGLGSIQDGWPSMAAGSFPVNDIPVRVHWETSLGLLPSQTRWHISVVVLRMIELRFLEKGPNFAFRWAALCGGNKERGLTKVFLSCT